MNKYLVKYPLDSLSTEIYWTGLPDFLSKKYTFCLSCQVNIKKCGKLKKKSGTHETENIALFKSKLTPKVDMYKYHNITCIIWILIHKQ